MATRIRLMREQDRIWLWNQLRDELGTHATEDLSREQLFQLLWWATTHIIDDTETSAQPFKESLVDSWRCAIESLPPHMRTSQGVRINRWIFLMLYRTWHRRYETGIWWARLMRRPIACNQLFRWWIDDRLTYRELRKLLSRPPYKRRNSEAERNAHRKRFADQLASSPPLAFRR